MKLFFRTFATACALIASLIVPQPALAQSDIWVSAYYAGWMQGWANNGRLPAEKIDYSAFTHIVHFSVTPRTDGTVNYDGNSITLTNSQALIPLAHAAGKKVIISVGGWGSDAGFRGATSDANRTKFINNLISFMQTRGYDGIDIDWERLESSDAGQYVTFINELRAAINQLSPRPLLTAAVAWHPTILAQVHTKFDQINIMTYDLAGAWPGWVTWHNSAIYDGGFKFPSSGGSVPSINGMVDSYVSSGIPLDKLGVGIDFYGYVWNGGSGMPNGGATDPRQGWSTAPTVQSNVPYYTIMDTYYQSNYYRWDNAAQVSFLSIDNTGSANDKFISYDDEETAKKKIDYARSKKIGGVIIWELGGGFRTNMPAGQQDPLLQAVKQAFGGGTPSPADVTPPTASFTGPSAGSILAGTVNVSANASDNVGIMGVQFKANGSNLGSEVTSSPYTASWNTTLIADGSVVLSAVARDAAGNQSTATITVSVANVPAADTAPPVISFTSPANGTAVSGTVNLTVSASDNVGVAGVQFSADGTNLGAEITTSPYTISWNSSQAASGDHTLTAVATDAAGNQSTATVTVSVSASAPPPSSNTLAVYEESLQSPWMNSSWSAAAAFDNAELAETGTRSVKVTTSPWGALSLHHGAWGSSAGVDPALYENLSLSVYAPSSGVLSIFFENDLGQSFPKVSSGTLNTGTWNRFSFTMSQLNPNGQTIHRISIQEVSGTTKTFYVDNLGFGGSSAPAPADPSKPVVVIDTPADGATISGTVELTATATDNVGVADIRFLLDGNELDGEDTSSPYTYSLNTAGVANGSHVITAVARDAADNEASVSVTVTVSNETTPPAPQNSLTVFDDALQTPWINASWSASITFGSTEKAFDGSSSIKVVQNAWGALRVHSGPWGNQVDVDGAQYENLEFSVFGGSVGVSIGVYFENDKGQSFPPLRYQWVQANQWRSFTIPMETLNPKKQAIHRVVIQDLSGRQRTFYVDQLRFTEGSTASSEMADNEAQLNESPESFEMKNYPNPFNPATTIAYALPFDAEVTLEVYNMLGERIALLVSEAQRTGLHSVQFDASRLASGTYVYRLNAIPTGDATVKPLVEVRRMVLLK